MTGRFGGDSAGVSTVLGAILVFGLLVVTLVTVQTEFVPVWDRDREADHMRIVQGQFAQIKSDADRLADNRSSVPVTGPVALGSAGGFRFFGAPRLPGELSFAPAPGGTGFTVAAPQLRIQVQNGQRVYAGSETWQQVTPSTVPAIQSVDHLRLRVATPHAWSTGHSVTLTIQDAAGAYAGMFNLHNIDHGSSYTFEYQTFAATSPTVPVTIVQESFEKQNPPAYQYVDLMRSEFLFGDVLRQAPAPYNLTLSRNTMNADYTVSYIAQAPGGGSVQVGSGGRIVPGFTQTLAGGGLSFAQANQQFPSQTFLLEHGAVLVEQQDGAAMQVAPQFGVTVAAGQVGVDWVVPALAGTAGAVAGPVSGSVTLEPTATRLDFKGTAPRLLFTLATRHGALWAQHWTSTLQQAGLSPAGAQPHFIVSADATSATLDLRGLQADPTSAVDDIVLTFKGAQLLASVEAAGGRA